MKFCPHCGKELLAQTKFCPDCGKSLGGSSGLGGYLNVLSLPKEFLMTLIGAVGVLIFSLRDWIDAEDEEIGLNLFKIWKEFEDSGMNRMLADVREFQMAKAVLAILLIMLIASFVLLAASLVRHRSKGRVTLAYWGFTLAAIVSGAVIIGILAIWQKFGEDGREILTVFPLLTCVTAVIGIIFLVEPRGEQGAAMRKASSCVLALSVTLIVVAVGMGIIANMVNNSAPEYTSSSIWAEPREMPIPIPRDRYDDWEDWYYYDREESDNRYWGWGH
jgi:hypothetical protein